MKTNRYTAETKSKTPGKNISAPEAEVTNISANGVWVYVKDREYLLSYGEYPWFRDASVAQILNLQFFHEHHLHWPELDVDIELDSLAHPEKYPLTSHSQPAPYPVAAAAF
jgi:hypothetical protein